MRSSRATCSASANGRPPYRRKTSKAPSPRVEALVGDRDPGLLGGPIAPSRLASMAAGYRRGADRCTGGGVAATSNQLAPASPGRRRRPRWRQKYSSSPSPRRSRRTPRAARSGTRSRSAGHRRAASSWRRRRASRTPARPLGRHPVDVGGERDHVRAVGVGGVDRERRTRSRTAGRRRCRATTRPASSDRWTPPWNCMKIRSGRGGARWIRCTQSAISSSGASSGR